MRKQIKRNGFFLAAGFRRVGYLPAKKAEEAGYYSAYVSSGNTGHPVGDMIVRKTLTEIKRIKIRWDFPAVFLCLWNNNVYFLSKLMKY